MKGARWKFHKFRSAKGGNRRDGTFGQSLPMPAGWPLSGDNPDIEPTPPEGRVWTLNRHKREDFAAMHSALIVQ